MKWNKYYILGGIIGFLVIWDIISLIDNTPIKKFDYPKIDISHLNASSDCSNTDSGWECVFDSKGNNTWERSNEISNLYKEKCEEQGGTFRCYGFCMPNYQHYCDFKYKDAGSICFSSEQCGGKCKAISGFMPFLGRCSEYTLRGCDWYTELFIGVPIPNHVLCD